MQYRAHHLVLGTYRIRNDAQLLALFRRRAQVREERVLVEVLKLNML